MKKNIRRALDTAVFAVMTLFILVFAAMLPAGAQVVTALPESVSGSTVFDFGNGPIELRITQGNALLFTSSGSGVGSTSGSSTALTLTATPTTLACVGCLISGSGITSGTTVTAASGTSVTLSAAMTVAASTPVAWGAACPTSPTGAVMPVQASVGGDWPFYTQARVCGSSQFGPGAGILPFPIGAH